VKFSIFSFQFSILVTCALLLVTPVLASENDIGYSKLDPSSPVYFLKVIRENIEMKAAVTQRVKWLRSLEFTTRRLREARSLIKKDTNLISPTLEKYSSHLRSLPDKNINDEEVGMRIKESLDIHLETLEQMYTQLSDKRAKMTIMATLNKIVNRADVSSDVKLSVCNLFAKESTSSALNQTEQFVLLERARTCQ